MADMVNDDPGEEMAKAILATINMNEVLLEEGVAELKQWITDHPRLPKSADDITLKTFIISCKSVERAKEKLESYYTARITYPKPFFENRDPCAVNWTGGQKLVCLPGHTPEGFKVILVTTTLKEFVHQLDLNEYYKFLLMYYEMFLRRFYMSSGVFVVLDMANASVELILKCTNKLFYTFSKMYQECYPLRFKGLIAFNAPYLLKPIFNIFVKPFFPPKLKERIFIHSSDHSCLDKYIPLDMLPSDYGGKNPSSDDLMELDKQYLESMRSWFLQEGSERPTEDVSS